MLVLAPDLVSTPLLQMDPLHKTLAIASPSTLPLTQPHHQLSNMTSLNPNILQPRRSRSAVSSREATLEHINGLPTNAFEAAYLPSDWSTWTHPRTNAAYDLTMQSALELPQDDFQTCFELIEGSSGEDYKASSVGWSEAGKKREMRSPELRYILIRPSNSSTIVGFLSFMPTFEASQPVLYIYEIHLSPTLQGSGLGAHLFRSVVQPVARAVGCLDKVMLTCFKSNEAALGFYTRKLGFVVDESSPADRRLRGGRVVTSDYVILSWGVGGGPLGDGGGR